MKKIMILLFLVFLTIAGHSQVTKDSTTYPLANKDTLRQIITTSVTTIQSVNKTVENKILPYVPPVIVTPPPVDTTKPPTGGARNNLMLDNSFEATPPYAGFTLADHQYCCDYSITQVGSPSGTGKVLKYTLNSSDAIVSSSKRAEIQLTTDAPEVSERWYGLRYYLQNYTADGGAESIFQFHDKDGTTPPLSIQVQSGRMNITQSFTSGNLHYDIGPSSSGQWISIVIHVKWTTATTGLLEVWRDGTKLVSKSNVRTNSKGGSYMKLGINKWSWAPGGGSSTATQRIFYIDDFRMGNEKATYNDVAP